MSDEIAAITSEDFEDAIERSFLVWIQNEIPSIVVTASGGNLTIPVVVLNCMPYEYYEKQRGDNILMDVQFGEIRTEGYSLGGELGDTRPASGESEAYFRNMPWMYKLGININIYTSSGMARAKVDGKLRTLLESIRRNVKDCPVYQWETDISSASAFNTGAFISVMNNNDAYVTRSEDFENFDYLSHWTINAQCPYLYDTKTDLVTSFEMNSQISNLLS